MSQPRIESFSDFWPYYVAAHSKKATRRFHAVGTALAVATLPIAALTTPWALLAAPLLGYGLAWYSHFFIEGNRPATFGYPLYSLASDFVMLAKMAAGTMDAEVERVLAGRAGAASALRGEPQEGLA